MRKLLSRAEAAGGAALTAALALFLVTASAPAMEAARAGLRLCGETVVPALFPFFVLSNLAVSLGFSAWLARRLSWLMGPLFRVGGGGAAALLLGLVGGYPVGARTAAALFQSGQCSRQEAQRLLAFCNNSGPAFILGVAGSAVFQSPRAGLFLLAVHMVCALLTGAVMARLLPGDRGRSAPPPPVAAVSFSRALTQGVTDGARSIFNVCAFVVFFNILLALLREMGAVDALVRLAALAGADPEWTSRLAAGVLELTTGMASLAPAGLTPGSLAMAAFFLGWGGVSVHFQTLSLLAGSGLSYAPCLAGKLLHGVLSAAAALTIGKYLFAPDAVSAFRPLPAPQGPTAALLAAGGILAGLALLRRVYQDCRGKKGQAHL